VTCILIARERIYKHVSMETDTLKPATHGILWKDEHV
jgi:hypothetical protein